MSAGLYELFARRLRFSFAGPRWGAVWGAFAKVLGDNSRRDALEAIRQRLPSHAGEDANGLTANDRQLERGPSESAADFAARLVAAHDQWRLAGTSLGLLIQLYYLDFTGAVIVQQNGLAYTLNAAPVLEDIAAPLLALPSWCTRTVISNGNPAIPVSADGKPAIAANTVPWWMFDHGMDFAGNQWCGRFAVLFPSTATDPALGTAANLARIQRTIKKWRPARALCYGIYVATAGKFVGWPDRLVNDGGTVGPATTNFYPGA